MRADGHIGGLSRTHPHFDNCAKGIIVTIDELVSRYETERDQCASARDNAVTAVKAILARAKDEGRANLTAEEDAAVQAEFAKRDTAARDLQAAEAKLRSATEARDAERQVTERLTRKDERAKVAVKPAYDGVARVGAEERTYNPGNCRKGGQFLRDVMLQHFFRDVQAEQRLVRHMQEEQVERGAYLQRAVGTGAFAGLTVPQYLTDMYAPATAALRPFADICNRHELPGQGMTVNISRITTATGAALQSAENAAVQETNMDDTLLTENVQTVAGQQTISRQAIDRGTGIEDVVIDDLYRRYATALDSTLINQATTGLSAVATATTYTDASPTGPEMWPKILGAGSGVEAALLGFAAPDAVVMHSRRWYWLQSQMTSTWPMFGQPGIPTQAAGVNFAEKYGSGARGILPNGMVAIVDNNIATNLGAGTNEDEVYIVPSTECHLWEDPEAPLFIRAEQPAAASLGVLLVLYGYMAFSLRRYVNGMGKISGTGLVSPAF